MGGVGCRWKALFHTEGVFEMGSAPPILYSMPFVFVYTPIGLSARYFCMVSMGSAPPILYKWCSGGSNGCKIINYAENKIPVANPWQYLFELPFSRRPCLRRTYCTMDQQFCKPYSFFTFKRNCNFPYVPRPVNILRVNANIVHGTSKLVYDETREKQKPTINVFPSNGVRSPCIRADSFQTNTILVTWGIDDGFRACSSDEIHSW